MKSKIVAIGDLHGHYDQFAELLAKLRMRDDIDFDRDTFVFVGDYVDGGSQTKQVLDKLIELKKKYPHWQILLGNHETLLLDGLSEKKPLYHDYYLWHNQGGRETLDSFKPSAEAGLSDYERSIMQSDDLITKPYIDFMREMPLFYETDNYFFLHGGLYPKRSIEAHKKSVGTFHPDLIREGDMSYDMLWMRDPFLRSKYDWGKKIIFGHTVFPYYDVWGTDPDNMERIQRGGYPLIMDNKIGLDTMRHNEGRLTAVILPDEEFVFSSWSGR